MLVTAIATTIYFANSLSSKESIMNRNNTGVTLLDRNGKEFYQFYDAHSDTRVALSNIAPVTQKALISSEDKNFYHHAGFSPAGIANAIAQNIKPSGTGGGGSTITQQLVKNALLSQERSYLRKYQELVLSIELERRYTKDEILEMYMNSAYFGEGAFGIEDAAKAYFNKSAKDLTLGESAMLIGVLPAPSAYSPISGDINKAKVRQKYVLDRMKDDGVITDVQEKEALAQELAYSESTADQHVLAPHFALMVKDELEERYGEEKVARSGYKVTTTIDLNAQTEAQYGVSTQIDALASSKVSNGAVVAIDPKTGEVLALVGSKDWTNESYGKVNMATATRQPGSSFKPIVYATGIEQNKLTAATIMHDEPADFGGGYSPKNYNLSYWGDVTVRRSLANSLNIPAVEAMQKVGIQNVLDQAKKMGITTLTESADTYGLPLALGSGQARLTEMTNAYAAFAFGGEKNNVTIVKSITNKDSKRIFEYKPKPTSAIGADTSYIISSILSDNSARAETFGSSLTLSDGRTAAVKTGTTEDYRDAWTIGYTPSLAVGVWIGNNDNTPMNSVAGSLGAAPIWRHVMNKMLQGKENENFVKPGRVVAQLICYGSGAVAQNAGDNTYTEYFKNGTLPSEQCNTVQQTKEEDKKKEEQPSDKSDDTTPTTPTQTEEPTDNTGTDSDNETGTGSDSGGTGTGTDTGTGEGSGTGTDTGTGTGTGDGTLPITP